jgi:hypothetical protein
LVALVSFDGRVYSNEAQTWDRLGRDPRGAHLIENAFDQWFSFATGRHTWISIQGQTIRGVVSARMRGSRLAWEVDCLIVATEEPQPVFDALIDQLTEAAVRAGTLRVFMRLEAGSDILVAARRAGFTPYASEALMKLSGDVSPAELDPDLQVRARERTDGFALFRLYNAVTPVEVRRHEAATYAEWIAGQEKRSQGRGKLDLVAQKDGEIVAWVRAVPDGDIGRLDLLIHPAAMCHGQALLRRAAEALGTRRPLYSLVPLYAGAVAELLEDNGFERVGEYAGLVKRLVVPIREAVPARVPAHRPLATG